jgi:hypothetical protein
MHGLVNRSIQYFITDTYGVNFWERVIDHAEVGFRDFDSFNTYDDALTVKLIAATSAILKRPLTTTLEDLGTYLVGNPSVYHVRRLLRLSGTHFTEFLTELEDLPERAKLALPDLDLPELRLLRCGPTDFQLSVDYPLPGAAYVVTGVLRAMADDYGALVVMDVNTNSEGREVISLTMPDPSFMAGRKFDLARVAK